ncbi:DUF6624 domain-containing protein [Arcticibacter sp.]|uniref:DUF6624 domain-containing protein n=1 Tax=Arcticibacter sp. TaxID=1872630 RepID=UPI00388E3CDB
MAQQDSTYQDLIAKAGLLHLQGNYKDAVDKYDQAFALQPPDALTAYKAAGVYSLSDSAKKALFYLNTALNEGTEAEYLIADPYFDFLRETEKPKWNALEELAILKEQEYAATLEVPDLREEINRMALKDQQLRFKRAQFSNDSVLTVINSKIQQSDDRNLTRAKEIIQHYGWPRRSDIGRDGQNNLWLIVQHADQDVTFQQVALTAMEKLKGTKELNMENYAFLYDRVQCNLNYKQRYGTQVIWTRTEKLPAFVES